MTDLETTATTATVTDKMTVVRPLLFPHWSRVVADFTIRLVAQHRAHLLAFCPGALLAALGSVPSHITRLPCAMVRRLSRSTLDCMANGHTLHQRETTRGASELLSSLSRGY